MTVLDVSFFVVALTIPSKIMFSSSKSGELDTTRLYFISCHGVSASLELFHLNTNLSLVLRISKTLSKTKYSVSEAYSYSPLVFSESAMSSLQRP